MCGNDCSPLMHRSLEHYPLPGSYVDYHYDQRGNSKHTKVSEKEALKETENDKKRGNTLKLTINLQTKREKMSVWKYRICSLELSKHSIWGRKKPCASRSLPFKPESKSERIIDTPHSQRVAVMPRTLITRRGTNTCKVSRRNSTTREHFGIHRNTNDPLGLIFNQDIFKCVSGFHCPRA